MGTNIFTFSSIIFQNYLISCFKPSLSPKTAWEGASHNDWHVLRYCQSFGPAAVTIAQRLTFRPGNDFAIQLVSHLTGDCSRLHLCCKTRGNFCKDMTASESVLVKLSVMTQSEDSHRNLHGSISTFDRAKTWSLLFCFMDLSCHWPKRTVKRVYCHVCKYKLFELIWLQ